MTIGLKIIVWVIKGSDSSRCSPELWPELSPDIKKLSLLKMSTSPALVTSQIAKAEVR